MTNNREQSWGPIVILGLFVAFLVWIFSKLFGSKKSRSWYEEAQAKLPEAIEKTNKRWGLSDEGLIERKKKRYRELRIPESLWHDIPESDRR